MVTEITSNAMRELPADVAMIELARMFMASQARGEIPRVYLSADGRITLRWQDGTKVSYVTGVSADMTPRDASRSVPSRKL